MAILSVFKTSTTASSPLDGSRGPESGQAENQVSDFLTVQSLANFGAMTGAITAAWGALQRLAWISPEAIWVPYSMALFWGLVSFLMSWSGLKSNNKVDLGNLLGALFVALINSLVLAGAVVGTAIVTTPGP